MSSALTETKTRGQPDRPVKVCDALGPSGRAWLRTRLICGGCSAAVNNGRSRGIPQQQQCMYVLRGSMATSTGQ